MRKHRHHHRHRKLSVEEKRHKFNREGLNKGRMFASQVIGHSFYSRLESNSSLRRRRGYRG